MGVDTDKATALFGYSDASPKYTHNPSFVSMSERLDMLTFDAPRTIVQSRGVVSVAGLSRRHTYMSLKIIGDLILALSVFSDKR